MKEHVQKTGVRKYAGDDLIELQAEPLKAIQLYFEEYGMCVVKGCEVSPAGSLYDVAAGLVALAGSDAEGNSAFKVVPFAGEENVSLPIYLTLNHTVVERAYADQRVKPIAYNYTAVASGVKPVAGVPFLEITTTGGKRFVDAIKVTEKLDKIGNGKDVTVTFSETSIRDNLTSGEKLSVLFGKVRKWFASLAVVAFSGRASDLSQDAGNRLVTDAEKTGWSDKYTKLQTDAKDADSLAAAKSYTDSLSGNVYKKTETYNRTEVDNKDSAALSAAKSYVDTLSGNVYKKSETYNRSEIDSKDAANLQAAKNYAAQKVADVVNNSPAALDTLQELADALGNDPNFATSIMAIIGGKADFVHSHSIAQVANLQAELNSKEPTFAKKTAFNKDFGATAGTVCQGNDARLSDARTPTVHSHTIAQVTNLQAELNGKESAFTKNTAFNKNFGTAAGTVCQGNDARLSDARTPTTHAHSIAQVTNLQAELNGKEPTFAKNTAFNKNFGTAAGTVAQGNHEHAGMMKIICVGEISSIGQIVKSAGKTFYVIKNSTGNFTVNHYYGGYGYFVMVCGILGGMAGYSAIAPNNFGVNVSTDAGFSFFMYTLDGIR